MMKLTFGPVRKMSMQARLQMFAIMLILPLLILIGVLLFMIVSQNYQYSMIARNLIVASEFNIDFKTSLDYKMYRYIIGGYRDFEAYAPFEDIDQARAVIERLKKMTIRDDSLTCLQYISHYLDNLEKYIKKSQQREDYATAMANLDSNIRIVTELVTNELHRYIYYETEELAALQQRVNTRTRSAAYLVGFLTVALIVVLWVVAVRNARSITRPVHEMCENIKMVGQGDFTVRPVDSNSDEIQTLSTAFDRMVGQIDRLVQNVRKQEEDLHRIELQLLQAQINPHFLYNTFDTIIWLAEDGQSKEVIEITSSLSSYFRTALSKGRDFITLREEEVHVRSYLQIQQVRYRDILTYEIDIPSLLNEIVLPKLTLQPLVENALYHGIKHKRDIGKIMVLAYRQEDTIYIIVEDNGAGMSPQRTEEVNEAIRHPKKNESFGCTNVHQRVSLCYGEPYGLRLVSTLGVGTKAILTIPVCFEETHNMTPIAQGIACSNINVK